jgi:cytochrome P450
MEKAAFATDPFPYFAAARAKHPWLAHSVFGFVVTEYTAMRDLLAMDGLRTANDGVVAILGGEGTDWGRFAERNIFGQQGDAHRRQRAALAPIFTLRHANAVRPMIREAIDGLLDEWVPKERFDFEEFASWFPISVICRLIGGPLEAIPRLKSSLETWGAAFHMDAAIVPQLAGMNQTFSWTFAVCWGVGRSTATPEHRRSRPCRGQQRPTRAEANRRSR